MPYELLTVKEAAELTRWSPATIYSKKCRGELPYTRVGRRSLRFRRSELLKLMRDYPAYTLPSSVGVAREGWQNE